MKYTPVFMLVFVVLFLLNLVRSFDADFENYRSELTTTLTSEQYLQGDKKKELRFNVTNNSQKEWHWLEYSVVVRDGSTELYSSQEVEPDWKVQSKSKAELIVEIPVFEGTVDTVLEIESLREVSIFRK